MDQKYIFGHANFLNELKDTLLLNIYNVVLYTWHIHINC